MRVISLIRRPAGHTVRVAGVTYTFASPDWACEIRHADHAEHFAGLGTGYRVEGFTPPMALSPVPLITVAADPDPATKPQRRPRRHLGQGPRDDAMTTATPG